MLKKRFAACVLAVSMAAMALCANGQQEGNGTAAKEDAGWPRKAVSILVGAKPGGGQDAAARLYAKYLQKYTGGVFNVVNVAGGSGTIATNQAKDAKADGTTMLEAHEALIANRLNGIVDYDYDAFEFAGCALFSKSMALMASSKYTSMDDVIAAAKAEPDTLVAATEWGGTTHQALISLEKSCGIDLNIVDAGSVGERITGVVGGTYDLTICQMGQAKDYIATGSMVPVLIFNRDVVDAYKDIPLASQYGSDYVFDKFFGLYFPKGTDPVVVTACRDALKKISEDPDFVKEAEGMQLIAGYEDSQEFLDEAKSNMAAYTQEYQIQ